MPVRAASEAWYWAIHARPSVCASRRAVGERGGRLVGEGAVDFVGELGERDEAGEGFGKEGGGGGRGGEAFAEGGDGAEGGGDGGDVARAAAAERDAGDGAGEVADGGEGVAQGRQGGAAGDEGADGVEARVDGGLVAERAGEPGAEEARAHRGAGGVEDLVERGAGGAAGGIREEVEVGARGFVEREVAGGGAEREAADVGDVAAEVVAHAAQERARGGVERGAALAAEAVERGDAEVAQQLVVRRDGVEVPFVDGRHAGDAGLGERGEDLAVARGGRGAGAVGDDRLAGGEPGEAGGELGAVRGRLAEELAGGELEHAHDEPLRALGGLGDDGDEVVVGVVGQERLLGDRAGGDDAGDLAADHAAALDALRVLHLVADGGLEAGADDLGEVGVDRVVRDAAHRLAGAVGEGEAEEGGGAAGVVHEQLVEVPEAEEEQRVAVQFLPHRAVLPQHRGEFFGHLRPEPVPPRRAPLRAGGGAAPRGALLALALDLPLVVLDRGEPVLAGGDAGAAAPLGPDVAHRVVLDLLLEHQELGEPPFGLQLRHPRVGLQERGEEGLEHVAHADHPRGDAVDRRVEVVEREDHAVRAGEGDLARDVGEHVVLAQDVVRVPAHGARDVERDLVGEEQHRRDLVRDVLAEVEVAAVEEAEHVVLRGVVHVELVRADGVALHADAEELALDRHLDERAVVVGREDFVERLLVDRARGRGHSIRLP